MFRVLEIPRSTKGRLRMSLVVGPTLVLVGVLAAVWLLGSGTSSTPQSPQLAGTSVYEAQLKPISSGPEWAFEADTAAFDPSGSVAVIDLRSAKQQVAWMDLRSGAITAKLNVAEAAFAVQRPSTHQLLVSDVLPRVADEPRATNRARLLVFDTANGLALQQNIDLPNRARYPVFGYPLALSSDQSRLVYIRYDFDPDSPECAATSSSVDQCGDRFSIVPIRMNEGFAVGAPVNLARGCHPALYPVGADGFAAICKDGSVTFLDKDFKTSDRVQFSQFGQQHKDRWGLPFAAEVAAATRDPNGRPVAIFHDGAVVRIGPLGPQAARALPDSAWIAGQGMVLDDHHLALPFKWNMTSGGVDGLAVFDSAALVIESVRTFAHADDVAALPGNNIFKLGAGVLTKLTTSGSAETPLGLVPPSAQVIVR